MNIESYQDFLTALRRDEEEKQYVGGGNPEFRCALFDLISTSPQTYRRYVKEMEREHKRQHKSQEI